MTDEKGNDPLASMSPDQLLVTLIRRMKWRWQLEKISQGTPSDVWDRWLVWNEDRDVVGDANTPEKALFMALYEPLGENQRKYSPRD